MLDAATLRRCWPTVRDAEAWAAALDAAAKRWTIMPGFELAIFLAQLGHECAEGEGLVENLAYLRPEHILDVFGARACRTAEARAALAARRPGQAWPPLALAEAAELARQPEKLGARVYAGRNGNGDEASGDGWRFRGGGGIQLTGRATYAAYGLAIKLGAEEAAQRARSGPEGAADSAGWYWAWRQLHAPARAGDNDRVGCLVTGAREPATMPGREDRRTRYARCREALGV